MTTNWQKRKIPEFVRARVQTLFVPFIFYSTVNYATFLFVNNSLQIEGNWLDYLIQILSQGWGGIALWFVPVFLLALIISKLILDYEKRWLLYSSIVLCSLLGALMDYESLIINPPLDSINRTNSLCIDVARKQFESNGNENNEYENLCFIGCYRRFSGYNCGEPLFSSRPCLQ